MTRSAPAAGLDFDRQRLQDYLRSLELLEPDEDATIERVGGGQSNPTYFVTAHQRRLVLRKKPVGALVASAHDVGREYRIMSALQGSAVPVPEPIRYCDNPDVLGTPFYLMQRIDGRIFHDARLPEVPREERRAVYFAQARALADLHNVDWDAVGLGDLARPGNFLQRQVLRWSAAWEDERVEDLARMREWLLSHMPARSARSLVHGDFKLNNLIFAGDRPELIGVLDWELAAIGDPLLDLGHIWAALWATTPEEYGGVRGTDLSAAGLPTDDEFLDAYFAESDATDRLDLFYKVLGLLRYAGIFNGIGQRAKAGSAAAADAADKAILGSVLLERALELIDS